MNKITLQDKTFKPYIPHAEIQAYVQSVAAAIFEDYKEETPLFIGVLNGVFMFFSDLLKAYPGPCEVAFLQVQSYSGTKSSGQVRSKMKLNKEIKNRHVILVEDIVDTGTTLASLYEEFHKPSRVKSLKIASLFLKPEVYAQPYTIDYVGKEIPNKFILGYGLDYNNLGRNLKDLYQLAD